tara:strand:- start:2301 stop:2585 length:285 start_codon:yes stop_codon:yes gene_type:complete
MMQTDVKAAHLDASGVVYVGRTRVKGYQIASGGTAGEIQFWDNATTNSGTEAITLNITANTAVIATLIPGEGVLFQNGVYVVLPASAAITVFYG